MRFTKILAVLLLLIFIAGSGCVKDTPQVEDDIIEDVSEDIPVVEETEPIMEEETPEEILEKSMPEAEETETSPEEASPTPYVMGSFYSNGIVSLKVPVDGVRVIDYVADFPTLIAMSGNRYIEVQVEIRNDKDKAVNMDSSQFTLVDSERYINTIDANQRYLSENLEDVSIPPLSKISGRLLFQVSTKRNVTELIFNGDGDSIIIEISLPEVIEDVSEEVTEGLSASAIENGILRTSYYSNIQFDDGALIRIISIKSQRPDKGITRLVATLKVENVKRVELTQESDFAILINGEVYQDVESIAYSEYDPKKEAVITIAIPGNLNDDDFKDNKFAIKYGDTVGSWTI
ncbi:MAG: DUF4352 domain-containing protein [Methanosarcinales archaeon]|nr:DUF4352 domain-containing protein [Methanosarcinales archaeon]